jgi:hypothetical protein
MRLTSSNRKQRRRDAALMRRHWSRPVPNCYVCDTTAGPFQMFVTADMDGNNARPLVVLCGGCLAEFRAEHPEIEVKKLADGFDARG